MTAEQTTSLETGWTPGGRHEQVSHLMATVPLVFLAAGDAHPWTWPAALALLLVVVGARPAVRRSRAAIYVALTHWLLTLGSWASVVVVAALGPPLSFAADDLALKVFAIAYAGVLCVLIAAVAMRFISSVLDHLTEHATAQDPGRQS